MSSKLLITSSLLIALGATGCGTANQERETRKRTPNHNIGEHDANDASSEPQGRATFALNLSPSLKQRAKTVSIRLFKQGCMPSPFEVYGPCDEKDSLGWLDQDFPANLDKFDFGQVPIGDYVITLQLHDAKGEIIAGGEGKATVAQGKTTQAKVSLDVVADQAAGSGKLVITIEDGGTGPSPSPAPLECNDSYQLPVCIKSGQGYKVQPFEQNAECKWVPEHNTLQIVDNQFCKGLPGSEGLYTPYGDEVLHPITPICTNEAKLPVCIYVGRSNLVKKQYFTKNERCEWIPSMDTLNLADERLCAGLAPNETRPAKK